MSPGRQRVAEDLMRAAGALVTVDEMVRGAVMRRARRIIADAAQRAERVARAACLGMNKVVVRPAAALLVDLSAKLLQLPPVPDPYAEAVRVSAFGPEAPASPAAPMTEEQIAAALADLEKVDAKDVPREAAGEEVGDGS